MAKRGHFCIFRQNKQKPIEKEIIIFDEKIIEKNINFSKDLNAKARFMIK